MFTSLIYVSDRADVPSSVNTFEERKRMQKKRFFIATSNFLPFLELRKRPN
ncbi:hypothetical protein M621_13805 [Serratia plymuthica S13]|uniref:Uncharacterized protein n=1 Tax=Serratia plymuthica S13 TaxID=1348660 RepID=S4YP55_SERPL|nr:hypothetical protein M621_13805 [Serratia plymuthica S13]